MCLDELVDVPICHAFWHHFELVITSDNSQQWQHILMAKGPPRHNPLAEPLYQSELAGPWPNWELTRVILPVSLVE